MPAGAAGPTLARIGARLPPDVNGCKIRRLAHDTLLFAALPALCALVVRSIDLASGGQPVPGGAGLVGARQDGLRDRHGDRADVLAHADGPVPARRRGHGGPAAP